MIPVSHIRAIVQGDIQGLIDAATPGGTTIDYKVSVGLDTAELIEKNALQGLHDDVCALAKTQGGEILLGVDGGKGVPTAVPGIVVLDPDAFTRQISTSMANAIEPTLPRVEIQPLAISSGRYVVIIRVGQSWNAPSPGEAVWAVLLVKVTWPSWTEGDQPSALVFPFASSGNHTLAGQ